MSVELVPQQAPPATPGRTFRVDGADTAARWSRTWPRLAWAAMAAGFVLIGAGNLDLNESESKLGLAAFERVAPFGQVFGGWEPGLWPAQVLASQLWARAEGGIPTAASVRWPSAIAGLVLGALLASRLAKVLGTRAGLLVSLCWFGSVALIDRSAFGVVDLIAALGVVGALDRLLARGSGWAAGAWMSLAFLGGGWPPVALILLTTVVMGRRGASPSWGLLLPPSLTFVAWSAWGLSTAQAPVWAAALALPMTQKADWLLAAGALGLSLPWGPFALGAAWRSVREAWGAPGRSYVVGWLQVAGASALAGTLIPGLASAARLPIVAGLAVAAAAVCDAAWAGSLKTGPRRWFLGVSLTLAALWAAWVVPNGGYLAAAMPYYLTVFVVLVGAAVMSAGVALTAAWGGRTRSALVVTAGLAACLKLAHWGYYVPEWNYRESQGPWGRAVGQWVPPRWPIYTTLSWRPDLAFATGHPFRQLPDARSLRFMTQDRPYFLLLHPAEFDHWPEGAPAVIKVRAFRDEDGHERVLARTGGSFAWYSLIKERELRD